MLCKGPRLGARVQSRAAEVAVVPQRNEEPKAWSQASLGWTEGTNGRWPRAHIRVGAEPEACPGKGATSSNLRCPAPDLNVYRRPGAGLSGNAREGHAHLPSKI